MVFNRTFSILSIWFSCFSCVLCASDDIWIGYWLQGCEYSAQGNHQEAIDFYTFAIETLEESDEQHLHIYNERGLSYVSIDQYSQAIEDYSRVIHKAKEIHSDVIFAWWGRFLVYAQLRDIQQCKIHYEKLQEIDPNFPRIEFANNCLIIKTNESWTENSKKQLAKRMQAVGICDKNTDVSFSPSGVCFVKTSTNFLEGQSCQKHEQNQSCMMNYTFSSKEDFSEFLSKKAAAVNPDDVNRCKENCASAAYYAAGLCAICPHTVCRTICLAAIEPLRRACNWCCESGDFYRTCIRPLRGFTPPPCEREDDQHE